MAGREGPWGEERRKGKQVGVSELTARDTDTHMTHGLHMGPGLCAQTDPPKRTLFSPHTVPGVACISAATKPLGYLARNEI